MKKSASVPLKRSCSSVGDLAVSSASANSGSDLDAKSMNSGLNQQLAVCQNLVPLVNIKIAGKWMFIPLKMVLIGIDPYPIIQSIQ
jgi:hypothetical protein